MAGTSEELAEESEARMTAPLRRAHLWIWIALAVLLPVLLIGALLARSTASLANPQFHWETYR